MCTTKGAILVQKLGVEKKFSTSVSGNFMMKKKPTAIKPKGGGRPLWPGH